MIRIGRVKKIVQVYLIYCRPKACSKWQLFEKEFVTNNLRESDPTDTGIRKKEKNNIKLKNVNNNTSLVTQSTFVQAMHSNDF